MRFLVQRVSRAQVSVDGNVTGAIGNGFLVLIGIRKTDLESDADYLLSKLAGLRVFADANGKMNLNIRQTGGALLLVSQFTLYGDCKRGLRPSFDDAAPPAEAERLYSYVVSRARETGIRVECGVFQAHMDVELVNDGPVTILIESDKYTSN